MFSHKKLLNFFPLKMKYLIEKIVLSMAGAHRTKGFICCRLYLISQWNSSLRVMLLKFVVKICEMSC